MRADCLRMVRMFRSARSLALLVASLALVVSSNGARAGDPPIDCENANTTVEMNFCGDKAFAAADKALNVAYRSALAAVKQRVLEPPYDARHYEEALRASQRAWVAFRDADCRDLVAQEWSGGTGTTSAVLSCMTSLTEERTKDIRGRFLAR